MRRLPSVVLVVGLLASSCAGDPSATTLRAPSTTASHLGGDRIAVQITGESYGHRSTPLVGTTALAPNGCWTLDLGDRRRLVVFPSGFISSGSMVKGPDGTEVLGDTAIDAKGGVVAAATLPGVPDGFWGNYLAFCDLGPEVVILDSLELAFRPAALSETDLVELLREADLTESWPCGLGFATSTANQWVALSVSFEDVADNQLELPVAFPDPSWSAVVRVGKHLMANNCDDVMEGWEPVPEIVATWPISGGQLEFIPPADGGCGGGEPVIATLRGGVVSTPHGDITLGDLTMVNDAYGCFAG